MSGQCHFPAEIERHINHTKTLSKDELVIFLNSIKSVEVDGLKCEIIQSVANNHHESFGVGPAAVALKDALLKDYVDYDVLKREGDSEINIVEVLSRHGFYNSAMSLFMKEKNRLGAFFVCSRVPLTNATVKAWASALIGSTDLSNEDITAAGKGIAFSNSDPWPIKLEGGKYNRRPPECPIWPEGSKLGGRMNVEFQLYFESIIEEVARRVDADKFSSDFLIERFKAIMKSISDQYFCRSSGWVLASFQGVSGEYDISNMPVDISNASGLSLVSSHYSSNHRKVTSLKPMDPSGMPISSVKVPSVLHAGTESMVGFNILEPIFHLLKFAKSQQARDMLVDVLLHITSESSTSPGYRLLHHNEYTRSLALLLATYQPCNETLCAILRGVERSLAFYETTAGGGQNYENKKLDVLYILCKALLSAKWVGDKAYKQFVDLVLANFDRYGVLLKQLCNSVRAIKVLLEIDDYSVRGVSKLTLCEALLSSGCYIDFAFYVYRGDVSPNLRVELAVPLIHYLVDEMHDVSLQKAYIAALLRPIYDLAALKSALLRQAVGDYRRERFWYDHGHELFGENVVFQFMKLLTKNRSFDCAYDMLTYHFSRQATSEEVALLLSVNPPDPENLQELQDFRVLAYRLKQAGAFAKRPFAKQLSLLHSLLLSSIGIEIPISPDKSKSSAVRRHYSIGKTIWLASQEGSLKAYLSKRVPSVYGNAMALIFARPMSASQLASHHFRQMDYIKDSFSKGNLSQYEGQIAFLSALVNLPPLSEGSYLFHSPEYLAHIKAILAAVLKYESLVDQQFEALPAPMSEAPAPSAPLLPVPSAPAMPPADGVVEAKRDSDVPEYAEEALLAENESLRREMAAQSEAVAHLKADKAALEAKLDEQAEKLRVMAAEKNSLVTRNEKLESQNAIYKEATRTVENLYYCAHSVRGMLASLTAVEEASTPEPS